MKKIVKNKIVKQNKKITKKILKNKNVKKLDLKKLQEHSKFQSTKHIEIMKDLINNNISFDKSHMIASRFY